MIRLKSLLKEEKVYRYNDKGIPASEIGRLLHIPKTGVILSAKRERHGFSVIYRDTPTSSRVSSFLSDVTIDRYAKLTDLPK